MCLSLCDVTGTIEFARSLFAAALLFVIGGYVGKGLYLYENKGSITAADVLTDKSFFVPDMYFWVFGATFLILLYLAFGLLRAILLLLHKAFKYIMWRICCRGCADEAEQEMKTVGDKRYQSLSTSIV
jgi:hypothetical protein